MSVWDDIADTPDEAANLALRAEFMHAIGEQVECRGWTQADAVRELGLTQPRVSALLRGKISQFSLDALVVIGLKLGLRAEVRVTDPGPVLAG
ncbi:helix-turn-helix domain-containing protein [Tsukamurella sp. PLM1]|uniref:helix-turn-helix domain-containing protein n=1 Tax=Tsukamurella sp. PLM1 TaxID=2929795 RepID=UPI0020638363|nr:XRE family transcriptional regulator [Tsukamurella sp. PLM1]BDH57800.1 hypothetical protein MTP03_27390 [Tsukamurella sp. PLM1]